MLPTEDPEAGHGFAATALAFYETIPSYARVIQRYYGAGVTDVVLNRLDAATLPQVWDIAGSLTLLPSK